MKQDINNCIEVYKSCLAEGYIQQAYIALTKYVGELKAKFPKEYKTGNISFGYLDYTYFPFFNTYLREKKLRFGIVLNHEKMQFELWLMGQNAAVQVEYWKKLKNLKWNKDMKKMPTYSVLEVCLESNLDFNNKDEMTAKILDKAMSLTKDIEKYLEEVK